MMRSAEDLLQELPPSTTPVIGITGPPGAGKSTLCAALMLHGWRLLSDELTLLEPGSGWVVPSPRPISLKNASIDVIRERDPGCVLGPVAHDTQKGTVAHLKVLPDSLARADERALPAWVVFPRCERGAALQAGLDPDHDLPLLAKPFSRDKLLAALSPLRS